MGRSVEDIALVEQAGVRLPEGAKITPMLRQWLSAKVKSRDSVLLFRMGDFYELFACDAERAGPLLDLTVTTRDRGKGDDAVAMAGFPHHAAPAYIARLVEAGCKVAVCDQMEDPALARGIVKRDVTRVITPGMVLDDESLDAASHNYLVAVARSDPGRPQVGLAALDLSTGAFICATGTEQAVLDEVARLSPRELLTPQDHSLPAPFLERLGAEGRRVEDRPLPGRGKSPLRALPGTADPLLRTAAYRSARAAAELCLGYVTETQGRVAAHISSPRPYALDAQLLVDATTRAHLDLVGPIGDQRAQGTLLGVADCTLTATGARALKRALLAPSTDLDTITARQNKVAQMLDEPGKRQAVRQVLRGFYDVERLVARVNSRRASPRDMGRIARSLFVLPDLVEVLLEVPAFQAVTQAALALGDLSARLDGALLEEQPPQLGGGRLFRRGFDADLDALVDLASGGRDAIAGLEKKERDATSIPNLKVKYTRVFGYYIEVTRTHLSKVPEHYSRKQTVAGGERYVTEELSRLEDQVASAEQRRDQREAQLYEALLDEVAASTPELLALCEQIAFLDVIAAFADLSERQRYCRPTLLPAKTRRLSLTGARHPCVEVALAEQGEAFVPSDLELNGAERQLLLVTGPNMAGKSTLMRQVALIQILAQAGCYVPATKAELSICDRIFTRVGASDDITRGRSTFMVEMTETAHILQSATAHSLLLLDEIGRGTSTFDGISIAWSVAEYIHQEVGARTLFATHYHELTELAEFMPRVKNVHVVVKEWNDEIVFTRTLAEGGAGRSYGIQVARLAGLPASVLVRARAVLAALEGQPVADAAETPRAHAAVNMPRPQMDFFASPVATSPTETQTVAGESSDIDHVHVAALQALRDELVKVDLNQTTPLAALNKLSKLVEKGRRLS